MTTSLLWFRKALRVRDNPALLEAATSTSTSASLACVFVLDAAFIDPAPGSRAGSGVGRASDVVLRFLGEALVDLDASLRALRPASAPNQRGLTVLHGDSLTQLQKTWRAIGAKTLYFEEEETEPFGKERDARVRAAAVADGLVVRAIPSHTLRPLASYPGGAMASKWTYQRFLTEFAQLPDVARPLPAPTSLPPSPARVAATDEPTATTVWRVLRITPTPAPNSPDKHLYPGGETHALTRLQAKVASRPAWVRSFAKPDTSPCATPTPSTTVLSPYLTFGCLSARDMWHALETAAATPSATQGGRLPPCTQPPVSLKGQLLWREFFYLVASRTPNFDGIDGNALCRPIPWAGCGPPHRHRLDDPIDANALAAWREGRTGHPFIDAVMRQLRHEGWIHHLARHAVACFLTRGDLWISWERGRDVFADLLLDGDWALNSANWMWVSCSSWFSRYLHVYGPESFPKKYDPHGVFVRKYVPEVAKLPDAYVYAPWKAPLSVQRAAGCVVGVDYPHPLVEDHLDASKRNIARLAAAFRASSGKASSASSASGAREDDAEEVEAVLSPRTTSAGASASASASAKRARKA